MSERDPRAIPPATYARLFEGTPGGPEVLEELVRLFMRPTYVKGGHEAERESCYRAGQHAVVNHILGRINVANGAEDPNDSGEQ